MGMGAAEAGAKGGHFDHGTDKDKDKVSDIQFNFDHSCVKSSPKMH
jgi:hypothetical protein